MSILTPAQKKCRDALIQRMDDTYVAELASACSPAWVAKKVLPTAFALRNSKLVELLLPLCAFNRTQAEHCLNELASTGENALIKKALDVITIDCNTLSSDPLQMAVCYGHTSVLQTLLTRFTSARHCTDVLLYSIAHDCQEGVEWVFDRADWSKALEIMEREADSSNYSDTEKLFVSKVQHARITAALTAANPSKAARKI